jgi:energy-converting hydrogenase B subunit D
MTVVQSVALALAAGLGLAVVLTRDPFRQAVVTGIYGMTLAVVFVAFQAPDVALSLVGVGAVALPLMIVLAIAKTRGRR